jgi:hypothetical protein
LLGLSAPDTEHTVRKFCLFYPNDTKKVMFWDLTISMLLLLTCVTTPLDLAFADEFDDIEWYTIFRNTIDILFFIDIVVIFNTAYQTDTMEI